MKKLIFIFLIITGAVKAQTQIPGFLIKRASGSITVNAQNELAVDTVSPTGAATKSDLAGFSASEKLNISDTAAMLSHYAELAELALKLSLSDTAAMLNNYAELQQLALKLNLSDTASMLSHYAELAELALKLNIADTAAMLSHYAELQELAAKLSISDTSSMLSHYAENAEVALKLSISDTAGMLNHYAENAEVVLKVNIADTAAMLSNYTEAAETALKLNISDTASMLNHYAENAEVALKVNISDTAAMLTNYPEKSESLLKANNLSDVASASSARGNLGATSVGSAIFTMTNPGAITYIRINPDNTVSTKTIAEVKIDLSLDRVDNTSDATKNGASATLTNKTISLGSNTLSGTTAQFNTALSDGDFATLAGSESLTNKTINLSSNTLTGTTAQFNTALSDGDFATLAGTEVLTNKTISGTSNTFSNIGNSSLSNSTISGISLGSNLANLSATDATITFSGSYNGGTARTLGINLNNANTWLQAQSVPDEAYDATSWNGSVQVPTKNAIRDKIESFLGRFSDTFLAADTTTAVGAVITVPNLTFTMAANETWNFDVHLVGQSSGTGGVKFQIVYSAVPTASTLWYSGNNSATNTIQSSPSTNTTPPQSNTLWAATATDLGAHIYGCVTNGASSCTVTLKFNPSNGAQTATLHRNSSMSARRTTN